MTQTIEAARFYAEHLGERQAVLEKILQECDYERLVVSSGHRLRYFADDQDAPFRTFGHFAHWLPLEGPGHLLELCGGQRPRLHLLAPRDYWHWHPPERDAFWSGHFETAEAGTEDEAWARLGDPRGAAYVGDDAPRAAAHGFAAAAINPPRLLARLDWERAYKSAYEVACLREAARRAAHAHRRVRAAFLEGASELALHRVYVETLGCVDEELPYPSIIACDRHAAALHYQAKDDSGGARVVLIDSGARYLGYCSDITRTWTVPECDALFRELLLALEGIQRATCAEVRPGLDFAELHGAMHLRIAELLHALGIFTVGPEEALARGLTGAFFPHGLGHFLGLQVHDVGGRQRGPDGGCAVPPPAYANLRTLRTLAARQVVTIEPGIYFIDMLLAPLREGSARSALDWRLIDRLRPCGGARVEDDVLVTGAAPRNLTREWLDG